MKKIREIIRLYNDAGLSMRDVARTTGVSRPVVSNTILKIKDLNLSYDDIQIITDSELQDLLLTKNHFPKTKAEVLRSNFPHYATELKKKGVTLQLLWEEYIEDDPNGLKISQFCHHFQQWKKDEKLSMHIDHKAGDKMYVDYAGHKLFITSPVNGEMISQEVFVAILPASQLTYAEASASQNQEDFMRSTERAIRYFGGVPSAIVPDNLKSGVIKADIYEPDLNPLFSDFAEFYRTAVMPARARKPKDKAHVENAVKIIYTRIFAPLRNKVFYSPEELNQAIKERLEEHNNKKLTKMKVSRRELFEQTERKALKSLPVSTYPLKYFQENTLVAFNYHIELKEDKHYYSVPYIIRGKRVKVIYDDRNVAIYYDNTRIVQHQRVRTPHKYTTIKDHMPPQHKFADNWNPDKLKWWAKDVGEETFQVITTLLNSKRYPEQSYKSCLGILGQAKKYGNQILNLACRKALNMEWISYKVISAETKRIQEQYEQEFQDKQLSLLPELHENIRGKENYK